jgi:ubiquinone/menaquinone biosynthesis C-methylase UbiE
MSPQTAMSNFKDKYVLGYTANERRRLALQATIINPLTEAFLRRAGISAGMRVLELGCGIGEVALIVARLVGPHGHVHCIDIDGDSLEIARGRIRSAGHDQATFEHIEVLQYMPALPYDAVVGRHILLHAADALAVLRKAVSMVHVGGLIAFHEHDVSFSPRVYPELPLMFSTLEMMINFWHRAVPRPNVGAQLFWLMQEAGLPPPECRAESVMDGGPYSTVYEWIAETMRSLLPRMEALGMVNAATFDCDTLAQRLRQEAVEKRGAFISAPLIGAFARKPSPLVARDNTSAQPLAPRCS